MLCYFTRLRRQDLLGVRIEDFDLEDSVLFVDPQKTGKQDVFPLHPIAADHVARVWGNRQFLFGLDVLINSDSNKRWRRIVQAAGVKRFTPHDIRRTAASEVNRVRHRMGEFLRQHRKYDVMHMYYLNEEEEFREALQKMRVPLAFRHGGKMVERERQDHEKKPERLHLSQFAAPAKPDSLEWKFEQPGTFWFRGTWYSLNGLPWFVLRELVTAEGSTDHS